MKPILKASSFLLALPLAVFAADTVQIQKISGTVEFKAEQGAWSQAQPGASVPSGGRVRTGADGRAELKFQNKTSVWLKPTTSVAISQKSPKHNQVALESGALKIRVPHLKFREKFEVKTPIAVASVRGTVFSINDAKVQTFFGKVDMHLDDGKVIDVPQGMGYSGPEGVTSLSQMEEALGLEDWSPGLSDEERQRGLQEFVENRQQIRDYAHDALARNAELVDGLAAEVKQADFAAGRTLVDAHGNLVRVEQRLERPRPDTIQVVNVTLRKSYAAGGLRHYSYNGPSGSRVDALIAKAQFNQALPEQINSFPGFFASHDDVKVNHASLILANLDDPSQIATIAFLGDRQSIATPGASDDVKSDLYVGSVNGRGTLFNLTAANAVTSTGGGLTRYLEDTGADSVNFKGGAGELYGSSASRFLPAATDYLGGANGSGTQPIWICSENYVINNAGGIRNVRDFTSSGTNVLSLLGNTAMQSVVFVKGDQANPGGSGRTARRPNNAVDVLPGGRNIDLVMIPDLFLSIVKSLATSADSLKTTY